MQLLPEFCLGIAWAVKGIERIYLDLYEGWNGSDLVDALGFPGNNTDCQGICCLFLKQWERALNFFSGLGRKFYLAS